MQSKVHRIRKCQTIDKYINLYSTFINKLELFLKRTKKRVQFYQRVRNYIEGKYKSIKYAWLYFRVFVSFPFIILNANDARTPYK